MPKIDLVQLSFGLAKSSDAVFDQVSSRLKKLNDDARLKLDINDKDVKQQLNDVSKWMESFSERGLNLGNVTGDFLRSLTDSSRTFEQNAAALGKMYSQMKIISGFTDEELAALSKIESINWDKIFEGANKPSEAIAKYLVDLDEAIAKFKELTKKGTKDSFAEAAKYFARISGLNGVGKLGLTAGDIEDWNNALMKPQSGQYAIGRTAAATAREILAATKNAMSVIQADIVKANLDSYLKEPHGGSGNGVAMDTTKLESAIKNLGSDISSHVDDAGDKISDAVNNLKQSIEDGIKVTETQEEEKGKSPVPTKKPSKSKTKQAEPEKPQYSEAELKMIEMYRGAAKKLIETQKTIEEVNKEYAQSGTGGRFGGTYTNGSFAKFNADQQKEAVDLFGMIHAYVLNGGDASKLAKPGAGSFYKAVLENKMDDYAPLFEPLRIAIEQEVAKIKQDTKEPPKLAEELPATVEGEKPVGVTINASNAKEFFEGLQAKADETPIEVTLTIKDRDNFVAEVKKAANGDEQVSADPNGDKKEPRADVPVTLTVSNPDDFYNAIQQNLNEREPITIKIKPAIDQNATEESPIKKYIVDAETAIKKIVALKKTVTRPDDTAWTPAMQRGIEEQLKYYARLEKLIPTFDASATGRFKDSSTLEMFDNLHKLLQQDLLLQERLGQNPNVMAEINAIKQYNERNPYADEIANLQLLQSTIAKITYNVQQKTEAFKQEDTTVASVVSSEIEQLNNLGDKINGLIDQIQGIFNEHKFDIGFKIDQKKLESVEEVTVGIKADVQQLHDDIEKGLAQQPPIKISITADELKTLAKHNGIEKYIVDADTAADKIVSLQQSLDKLKNSDKLTSAQKNKMFTTFPEQLKYYARLINLIPEFEPDDYFGEKYDDYFEEKETKYKSLVENFKRLTKYFYSGQPIGHDDLALVTNTLKDVQQIYAISSFSQNSPYQVEINELDLLLEKLRDVKRAIIEKTEQIKTEASEMTKAVDSELGDLNRLGENVEKLKEKIKAAISFAINGENDTGVPIKVTITEEDAKQFIDILQQQIVASGGVKVDLDEKYLTSQIETIFKNTKFKAAVDATVNQTSSAGGERVITGESILDILKGWNEANEMSVSKHGYRVNLRERAMFFNSKTGEHTNPYTFDSFGSYKLMYETLKDQMNKIGESYDDVLKSFDSFIHTHPEYFTAFSSEDLRTMANYKERGSAQSQFVLGLSEITHLDTKKISDSDLLKLADYTDKIASDYSKQPQSDELKKLQYSFTTLKNFLLYTDKFGIFTETLNDFGSNLFDELKDNNLLKYLSGDGQRHLKDAKGILSILSSSEEISGRAHNINSYKTAIMEYAKSAIISTLVGDERFTIEDSIGEIIQQVFDSSSVGGFKSQLSKSLSSMSQDQSWSIFAPEKVRESFDKWIGSQQMKWLSQNGYNVSEVMQKWSWDDFVKNDPMHLGSAVVQQMQQMVQGDQQNQNEQITPQVNFTEQAKQIAQTIKTEIEAALSGENQIPINVIISPDSLTKIREQLQAKFAESPFELNINQESLVKQIETALSSIDFVTQLQNMAVKNPDGTTSIQAHQVLDAVNASESKTQEVGGKAIPVPIEGKVEDPAAFILSIQNQLTGQTVKVNISPNGTLDEFVSGVQTILGLIDNALPSQPIGVKIAPVTDQKQPTAEAVHYTTNADALQEEATKVSNLKIAVSYLKDMIDKKTEAIEREASVMAESVLAEMTALDALKKKVGEVEERIKKLLNGEQGSREIELKLPQKLPKAEIQPDTKYFIEQLKEALKNAGLIVRVKAEVEKKVVEKKVVEKTKATNQTTSSQQVNSSQSTNNGAVNHLTLDDINALRDEAAIRRKQAEDERSQAIENNLEKQKNLYANIVKTKYEIDKLDKNRANLSQEQLDDLEKLKTQLIEYQKQLIKTRKDFRLYNDPKANEGLLEIYQYTKRHTEGEIKAAEREKKRTEYSELVSANKENIDLYFEKLSKIRELATEISTLQFKGEPTDELRKDLDKTIAEAEELRKSLEDIGIKDVQFSDPVVNKRIEVGVDKKGEPITAKPIEPYEGEYFRLQSKNDTHSQQYVDLVNKLGEKIDYINKHPLDIITSKEFAELESFIDYINSIEKSTKLTDPTRISKQSANFEQWVARNSRAAETYKTEIEQIRSAYTEMQTDHKKFGTNEYLKETISLFAKLQATAAREGNLGPSFFESWQKRVRGIATYLTSFFSFYRVIGTIRNVISTVQQLNASMVEMSKTAGTTLSNIESEFQNFYKIAQETGGTIQDTITATTDWVRNGFDIPQAEELSRVAQIYKNVGYGVDINSANEYLISTLRGFNIEAENAISIVDKINEVGNNFPIDQKGIGEALQRSAASFAAANTDLSKSIALITAANTVVQDPQKVGSHN